jgi:hypothetical protein
VVYESRPEVKISPQNPQAVRVAFADWLFEMAESDVPYQARSLAICVASFKTVADLGLGGLSGMSDRTFDKWRRYLIEGGWVTIIGNDVEPALRGAPVEFSDLTRMGPGLCAALPDTSREWLRQATILAFGFQCSHCDTIGDEDVGPDGRPWCLDRIIPGKVGGEYVADNVTLSCWGCNSRRGASPIEQRTFSLADWRALRAAWQDVGTSVAEVCCG